MIAGSSKKTNGAINKCDTFVLIYSRINLYAQLMHSIGGVIVDTRYIQFFISFY